MLYLGIVAGHVSATVCGFAIASLSRGRSLSLSLGQRSPIPRPVRGAAYEPFSAKTSLLSPNDRNNVIDDILEVVVTAERQTHWEYNK